MAIKRRSTTPTIIIGFGVLTMMVFAFGVKWTGTQPIVKLKTELEKHFNVRGFHTALKLKENRFEVQPPAVLSQDRAFRRQIGGYALLKYFELTEGKTVVESVTVIAPKGTTLPEETVTLGAATAAHDVEGQANALLSSGAIAPAFSATIGVAPGIRGSAIYVSAPAGTVLSAAEARRLGQLFLTQPALVSFVRVDRGDGACYETGDDVAFLGSTAGAVAPLAPPQPR